MITLHQQVLLPIPGNEKGLLHFHKKLADCLLREF